VSSISRFEIIGSHSGSDSNSSFLGYDAFSTDNFSHFLPLKMDAISCSETLVTYTNQNGVTSQKIGVFHNKIRLKQLFWAKYIT